jgi:DNA-3-methyladenine glycosylase II
VGKTLLQLKKDPVMAGLIDEYTLEKWKYNRSIYEALLSAIVGQQLSVKAADTIWGRVETLLGKDLSPENIIKTEDQKFRDAGMSWAKIKYVNGIAEAHKNGEIDPEKINDMSDEEVITELTKLKGVGKWTVEMILIFTLKRPDVFSIGDVGLRNAVANLYGVDRDDLEEIEKISLKWKPYRSTASRYLWKSLQNEPLKSKD